MPRDLIDAAAPRQRKATDIVQLKLRFREDMRAELEKSAKSRGASLNAEIVSRLSVSFDLEALALKRMASWLGGAENTLFYTAVAHEIRKCGDRPLRELLADPALCERVRAAVLETLELWRAQGDSAPSRTASIGASRQP
jgi:hypothetical protein